jgi:hypothetical protein
MKIYIGKNKKNATEIDLKTLIGLSLNSFLENKNAKITMDRFGDNSASWIDIRQDSKDKKSVVDVYLGFDPKNDNNLIEINVWESKYIVDDEHAKKLV